MKEDEALRVLKGVLEQEGAAWIEEGGWVRFRTKHEAMLWETSCCFAGGSLLLFSQFPFQCADRDRAWRVCGELNRSLITGALFLAEDGAPVYRCRANLDDVYGARKRIEAALDYAARVMTHCWGKLSGT